MEDAMSYRLLTVTLIAACAVFATQSYAETDLNASKSNTSKQSSKVLKATGAGGGGAGVTTVKSSKSNTSDRMGGGGGGKGAVQLNPQPEPPGRR
jgi:hypothetical protein